MSDIAIQVAWGFHLDPPIDNAEEFHDLGERLMVELLKLEECNGNVFDSTTSTDANAGTILVEVLVTGDEFVATMQMALDVIRTAIHATGGGTPGWPTAEDLVPGDFTAKPVGVPALV